MAGLIKINNAEAWSAAGWAFDHVLRQSIPFVPSDSERLLYVLRKGMIQGVNYINLSELSRTDKLTFLHALKTGFYHTEKAGSEAFAEPTFYPGFIERFNELIDMLSSDLKIATESERGSSGAI